MKKIFTLMAVAFMAASAQAQTYKTITGQLYYPLTEANVAAANAEGWAVIGDNRTDNKNSVINPETGESQSSTKTPGVGIKKGNSSKSIKVYITGASFAGFIGQSTSGDEVRGALVTATPESGDAVQENFTTGTTAIQNGVTLDPTKKYTVTYEGVSEDGTSAKDFVVFGLVFSASTATGISTVKTDAADAPVYNMAGQQVTSAYKGVVVKNGKKLIQK